MHPTSEARAWLAGWRSADEWINVGQWQWPLVPIDEIEDA